MKRIKIPGPPTGYTDLMDAALMAQQEEAKKKPKYFPLRPSAAGYCTRRLAYDMMSYHGHADYEAETKEPPTLRLLNLGNSVEHHSLRNFALIANAREDFQLKYKQQTVTLFKLAPTEIYPDGKLIEGSMDLAVVCTEYGNGIGDVKSKKDKFHAYYKTDWDSMTARLNEMASVTKLSDTSFYAPNLEKFLEELHDEFFEHNFHQINSYLCSPWAKEHNFDHGFVYRYNKNDSRHLEIRFAPSEKLFEKLRTKFETVNQAISTSKPDIESVPRDYALGSIVCAFCPRKKECWDKSDPLKEFFNQLPNKKRPEKITGTLAVAIGEFAAATGEASTAKDLEQQIVKQMLERNLSKVKLPNGDIYELKRNKNEIKLKRSKL